MGPSGNGLVGADERGGKPAESRAYRMGAPVRFQKAVSRSKENVAVKRRKASRSASWTGRSLPLKGQAQPQGGHRVRRSAPAPVGASPPRMGGHPQRRPGARSPETMELGSMKHDGHQTSGTMQHPSST